MEKRIYSVSDITFTIKSLLEESLPTIWVEGEISNFKPHYSGHFYFTLKDNNAQLSVVMWRTRAEQNPFNIEDGMLVRCLGNIRVYERYGKYQLDVLQIEPAGIGTLQEQFEELKKKLSNEGLFSVEFKKQIPEFPDTVAVITSPTGAAVQDILSVLQRRAPYLNIILKPVKVQGDGAAKEIASAIYEINRERQCDTIIVGRGGGSLEDLWAFNEEIVARAIFDSSIPVISAIGHEIDFTIADFVADLRAPTPSVAAELAVPDKNELTGLFLSYNNKLLNLLNNRIDSGRQKLNYLKNSYGLKRYEDVLYQNYQRIDDLNLKLSVSIKRILEEKFNNTGQFQKTLHNLNPSNILERGYSITLYNGKPLIDAQNIEKEQEIETRLFKGQLKSNVTATFKEGHDG